MMRSFGILRVDLITTDFSQSHDDIDSYLGYFGKELIDGTAADANDLQDLILLVVLGVSVLIGVFASQLAGETWESVAEEVEAEKLKKKLEAQNGEGGEVDDGITRSLFGFEFPEWVIGAQIALKQADVRMEKMIQTEYKAAVWNCTDDNPPPFTKDPSKFNDSPEVLGAWKGFDAVAAICDGFVLSPSLIKAYFKYGDPLYDISKDDDIIEDFNPRLLESVNKLETKVETPEKNKIPEPLSIQTVSEESILKSLRFVRENVIVRLEKIEKDLKNM
jgi:hypothetical protein